MNVQSTHSIAAAQTKRVVIPELASFPTFPGLVV